MARQRILRAYIAQMFSTNAVLAARTRPEDGKPAVPVRCHRARSVVFPLRAPLWDQARRLSPTVISRRIRVPAGYLGPRRGALKLKRDQQLRLPETAGRNRAGCPQNTGLCGHWSPGMGRLARPLPGCLRYLCHDPRRLAGAPGFEPGNGGIKILCLTAWRRPSRRPFGRART